MSCASHQIFGRLEGKGEVMSLILTGEQGCCLTAEILTYGATLKRLLVPDKNKQLHDVVLGCSTLEDYVQSSAYMGCIVGRVANRIKNGTFVLNRCTYVLDKNNGQNHLHGGKYGLSKKVWSIIDSSPSHVTMNCKSDDRVDDESSKQTENYSSGYPGYLDARVTYRLQKDLDNNWGLTIHFQATCDQSTPVSLTSHSYFNLSKTCDVRDHKISFNADQYLPTNEHCLVTGKIETVHGTKYDLLRPTTLGDQVFDNYFCIKDYQHHGGCQKSKYKFAASVHSESSGITMNVQTTYPGFQFYTGDFLNNHPAKLEHLECCNQNYDKRGGFCIEAHNFPDAVNNPNFPTTILHPGDTYDHVIIYSFPQIIY